MTSLLPLTPDQIARVARARELGEWKSNTFVDPLERLAFRAGQHDFDELHRLVDAARGAGFEFKAIAFALGEISDPDDVDCVVMGALRVGAAHRRWLRKQQEDG